MQKFALVASAMGGALAIACGAQPTEPRRPAEQPAAPRLHEGPLTDYLAAAGLRWLVVGRPAELSRDQKLLATLEPILPARRLDGFRASSGIDLRETPAALAAGYDYGTLYMAETPGPNQHVEELFTERLLQGANARAPHPALRIVSGVVGTTPQTFVRIDQKLIAVAVGDPTPARVVEGFARRKLVRSKPALSGSALSTLPTEVEKAPVRFYAPGPFRDDWLNGANGLFAATLAVGMTLSPVGHDRLRAKVILAGEWRDESSAPRLEATWRDLEASPMGRLLGLDRSVTPPRIAVTPKALTLEVELELEGLVRGIHAAVSADVWEILDLGSPEQGPDRGRRGADFEAADGGAAPRPKKD